MKLVVLDSYEPQMSYVYHVNEEYLTGRIPQANAHYKF